MSIVKRFKNMDSSLTDLYRDIVTEIKKEKELKITNKLEGKTKNGKSFLSVGAARVSPPTKVSGEIRELTITITGTSNDYVVEIHTGCWKTSSVQVENTFPPEETSKEFQPIFGVPAFRYRRDLIRRIDELVRKHSKNDLDLENIEIIDG